MTPAIDRRGSLPEWASPPSLFDSVGPGATCEFWYGGNFCPMAPALSSGLPACEDPKFLSGGIFAAKSEMLDIPPSCRSPRRRATVPNFQPGGSLGGDRPTSAPASRHAPTRKRGRSRPQAKQWWRWPCRSRAPSDTHLLAPPHALATTARQSALSLGTSPMPESNAAAGASLSHLSFALV